MRKIFPFVILMSFLGSCSQDNDAVTDDSHEDLIVWQIVNGEKVDSGYRFPTDDEMQELYSKGWLDKESVELRAIECRWADGYGGSMDCIGNACHVVFHQQLGTPCIGCFTDDPSGAHTDYHGDGVCR